MNRLLGGMLALVMVVWGTGYWLGQRHQGVQADRAMSAGRSGWSMPRLWGDDRVHYRIGQVDARFGLSPSELEQLTREAVAIWEQPTGRQLFVYDPQASLTLNMVYDERQQQSTASQRQEQVLLQQKNQAEQMYDNYQRQQADLEQERGRLDAQIRELQQRAYQAGVDARKSIESGEDAEVVNARLDIFRAELRAQSEQLDRQRQLFNDRVDRVNAMGSTTHQAVDDLKSGVRDYQSTYASHEFQKGVYTGREINIYEYRNHDDLRLALAHELGHALGLAHNQDPKALMYPVLDQQQRSGFTLTAADQQLLAAGRR